MARSSWTWNGITSSISCQTGRPRRLRPGCKDIPRWRSSAGTAPASTPTPPGRARRRRASTHSVGTRDRWHLLRNVGDALERLLSRQHQTLQRLEADLRAAAAGTATPSGETPEHDAKGSPSAASPPLAPTAAERERQTHRAGRLARYEEVAALHAQGSGISTIAKRPGMARKTVRRFLRGDGSPERAERTGSWGRLAGFEPYLRRRWDDGCRNASQLHREIKAQGYPGAASYVGQVLGTWRTETAPTGRRRLHALAARPAPHRLRPARSPRQVRWLLHRPVEQLSPSDRAYRDALLAACPAVQAAQTLVAEFTRLVAAHDVAALAPWLTAAKESDAPELRGAALGICQDRVAVEAGISEPWSQGQVEGQVNRLKEIKRAMYGRANFDLLRRRVLCPV